MEAGPGLVSTAARLNASCPERPEQPHPALASARTADEELGRRSGAQRAPCLIGEEEESPLTSLAFDVAQA
jgi:hypothetical protein